jgi:hypothetical protein
MSALHFAAGPLWVGKEEMRRGAFVIGRMVDGFARTGMIARTSDSSSTFTIRGVEFVDNLSERIRVRPRPVSRTRRPAIP